MELSQSSNIYDRLSTDECLDHLSTGYVRKEYESFNLFPSTLLPIITQFIRNILYRFAKHLLQPYSMKIIEGSNNTMVELIRGSNSSDLGGSALLNVAIPVIDNRCKYEWKIRINAQKRSTGNYHYFIGVASNKCKNFEASAHEGLKHSYGILGGIAGIVINGRSTSDKECRHKRKFMFNNENIICIEYDGKTKQLTFSKVVNNKTNEMTQIYILSLPKDNKEITHWYPAISIKDPGDTAEIVF